MRVFDSPQQRLIYILFETTTNALSEEDRPQHQDHYPALFAVYDIYRLQWRYEWISVGLFYNYNSSYSYNFINLLCNDLCGFFSCVTKHLCHSQNWIVRASWCWHIPNLGLFKNYVQIRLICSFEFLLIYFNLTCKNWMFQTSFQISWIMPYYR